VITKYPTKTILKKTNPTKTRSRRSIVANPKMNGPLELLDATSGVGARGCRGNGSDEEQAVERAE
jgi:hypothetical protein